MAILDTTDLYDIEISTVSSSEADISTIRDKIKNQDVDLLIVYEEGFNDKVLGGLMPSVSIYYNSASNSSSEIYNYYYTGIFGMSAEYKYLVNLNPDISYDLATKEDISTMMITMLMPFLLIILLFSGCMTIVIESIAGEKERGTIATLLVTPVSRKAIAIGKIVALSITSLVSALSSFLGVILSLPKLMDGIDVDISMYGVLEYLQLFAVIITTVLLFTVILSIASCFAKSVKEANTYATPIMIVVMLLGLGSSYGSTVASSNMFLYFVPILNSVQCMTAVFGMTFNIVNFAITILMNLVYVVVGVLVLNKMFDSENIMFNK